MALKVCADPDCTELTATGHCPLHAREAWAGSTRRARLPKDWASRVRAVRARDPICQVCGDALSTQVDHVEPDDNHSLSNLQGICDQCHTAKTQAEAARARQTTSRA